MDDFFCEILSRSMRAWTLEDTIKSNNPLCREENFFQIVQVGFSFF
jgi:hypothetical protein